MASDGELAGVEALATRVKQLLWVVLDSMPSELVPWSLMLVKLLHAADTFPRGGLYDGHYAAQAALRYEVFWLPLAARAQRSSRGHVLVPPLDVSVAWLVHRCLAPGTYAADCEALLGRVLDPPPAQAFRFAGAHAYSQCEGPEQREAWASRELWDAAYVHGAGSFDVHSAAPSPGPGSEASSPRPELGPLPLRNGGSSGGGGGGGGGGSWTGPRKFGRGSSSRGGSSNGSDGGGSPGAKLAVPVAAATAAGGRDGSGGGGPRLQSQYWPPAPRGSRWDLMRLCPLVVADPSSVASSGGTASVALLGRGRLAGQLVGRMGELAPLLHSLLRPAFLDPDVLAQAVQRYCRFLMLQGMHPSVPMVPTTDIALMWVAHMALPGAYRETCRRLLGRVVMPAPGALRLDDSGPDFAETRRLYEHHFGEVYDPPITRAVPMSVPHPLLSSPLAPFLSAFEVVPTGADVVLAAAYFGPDTGVASPVTQQVRQQMRYDKGTGEYVNGGVDAEAGAGLHRCGAHALYLAYLLRRGGSRSHRSLLGLVLGQAHKRRAAVKYVANKASGFRDFLHLPHSDYHPYWRKLRLRPVDPEAVPAAFDARTPTSDGYEVHDDAVQQLRAEEELYGTGDSDSDDGDSRRRSRGSQGGQEEQERQHAAVRQALAQAQAAAAAAATAAAAAAPERQGGPGNDTGGGGGGGGGGFLTPVGGSRRNSFMDLNGGTAPRPPPAPMSTSSGGSSRAGGDGASQLPPGQQRLRDPPRAAAAAANRAAAAAAAAARERERERAKRISLIVPLPTAPAAPYSTLTFTAAASDDDDGGPSRQSSEPESAAGDVLSVQSPTGPEIAAADGAVHATAEVPPAAAAAEPTVDLAAGLMAAAAAAKASLKTAWAMPRRSRDSGSATTTEGGASTDGAMPSPPRRMPSIERRRGQAEDGTDEWAYNNPYYVDRLLELGPLSPLSPLGQAPTPASVAILATRGAAGPAAETPASPPPPPPSGSARGFGGEVWAVRVPLPETVESQQAGGAATAAAAAVASASAGSDADGDGSGGSSGAAASRRLRHLRSALLGEEGGVPLAPGSAYASCHSSSGDSAEDDDGKGPKREEQDGGSGAAARAAVQVKQRGSRRERAASSDEDPGEVFSTPSAAFAASVTTPFTPDRSADGGGAAADDDPSAMAVVTATATVTLPGAARTAAAAPSGGDATTSGGFAFAAPVEAVQPVVPVGGTGSGGPGGTYIGGIGGFSRVSAHSTSRLARVTSANPVPAPLQSLPPPPPAVTASPLINNLPRAASALTPLRASSGLPPRPAPSAASASGVTPPKRAAGAYGPADLSYMGGLGGVANLVTRGESSPQFSKSLREQYTGRSAPAAGLGSGGAGGGFVGSGSAGGGSSSAGVSTPPVSSSGASFCSAVSGRSSGGRGSGARPHPPLGGRGAGVAPRRQPRYQSPGPEVGGPEEGGLKKGGPEEGGPEEGGA